MSHTDCNANRLSTIPPSRTPPWGRDSQSPVQETLTEENNNGTLSLEPRVTYLRSTVPPTSPATAYTVTLPAGTYARQEKRIYIPGDIVATTAPWKVAGTFLGFGYLLFNSLGTSGVLEWDGNAWQWLGGTAAQQN